MSDQLKQSAYHFTQSEACRKLASSYPKTSALWASFMQVASAHHEVSRAFMRLERVESEQAELEAIVRKKLHMDERDYWTRQQLTPNDKITGHAPKGDSSEQ
jgi:hypothetical protein